MFKINSTSLSLKQSIAYALLEGTDIIQADKPEILQLFLDCMDRYDRDEQRLILPVVRRVVGMMNLSWRKMATFANIDAFLQNPHIVAMTKAANDIHASKTFKNIDFEADYMAMIATAFIAEYK